MPKREKEAKKRSLGMVTIKGPIFISKESLANLEKIAAKARPPKCHLEVETIGDSHEYKCVGTCPPGESCTMDLHFENDKLVIEGCSCKGW